MIMPNGRWYLELNVAKDHPNLLQEASDYLNTTCGRWAGLGRGEALASLKHAEAPHHAG